MTPIANTLDTVLNLCQRHIEKDGRLMAAEPLVNNPSGSAGMPFGALTLSLGSASFAILAFTTPKYAIQTVQFSQNITRRALARRAPYIILSNLQEMILVATPRRPEQPAEVIRSYPLLFLSSMELGGELSVPDQIEFNQMLSRVLDDLIALSKDGRLFMVVPDADYFVSRLVKAVDVLKPLVTGALISEISLKPDFAQSLSDWAVPQGIPVDLKSEAFAEAVVRQAIYRLLGKIIFYQSLRRARPDLPELDLAGMDTSQVQSRLNDCFARAHQIDYHAVFREDILDRLPFPANASAELRELVQDLNTRDFAHLPQDVVGAVFERLIPPEDRHALGQFFTPEPLVDLITGFCVRHADDAVLDPTCGTGTFLIRAYNCLQTTHGVHDHRRLLGQLWGVDIAPFPAELATINLFRQNVADAGNFPRILNDDFFQVVPGGRYRFPPLKADADIQAEVDEAIPQFDAIVGNFPYIGADRIEQSQQGYLRQVVYRRIVDEWLEHYPSGFRFPQKGTQKEFALACRNKMSLETFRAQAEPDVSTYSDLYAYLFWHAAAFLKPGGRMGIVTSNAWLDVGFGYGLQRFFLNHFKIIAILESRCEPWFEQAAVNTVVTILERCEDAAECDAHPARFVRIKVPLNQLIPWDIHHDGLNRWLGIGGIVQQVESVHAASTDPRNPVSWENETLRVRTVNQGALRRQLEESGKTAKWGAYLRAPQVYFDFLACSGQNLALLRDIAPPARGGTTRINEFFHVDSATIDQWGIDAEFCLPLIKSPGETSTILIEQSLLELKVFVCRKSKDELRKSKQLGTLAYIEWGEQQKYITGVQRGMKWPDGPWVQDRKPGWYALPESETHQSCLFFTQAYGDRHIQRYCRTPLIADARLYYLSPVQENNEIVSAVLNCSMMALFTEIAGRVSMGDGALELKVEDARDYLLVPDIRRFTPQHQQQILDAFEPLLHRSIGSVFEEVRQADRQALDSAVLIALGLNPAEWLQPLYNGLTTLTRERTELGKKRNQTRKGRRQRAAGRVLEEVLDELLPDGPRTFPDDFYSAVARADGWREIQLPESRLRHVGHMFGQEELSNDSGLSIKVNNPLEVQFVLFAQAVGQTMARLPSKPVEVARTVNDYKKYLRNLRAQLSEAYFRRTMDQTQAERLTSEAWRKLALPAWEE